jgi:hypothetical protein
VSRGVRRVIDVLLQWIEISPSDFQALEVVTLFSNWVALLQNGSSDEQAYAEKIHKAWKKTQVGVYFYSLFFPSRHHNKNFARLLLDIFLTRSLLQKVEPELKKLPAEVVKRLKKSSKESKKILNPQLGSSLGLDTVPPVIMAIHITFLETQIMKKFRPRDFLNKEWERQKNGTWAELRDNYNKVNTPKYFLSFFFPL